jgi:hypothetical protein
MTVRKNHLRNWPYGVYETEAGPILFDRDYRPIALFGRKGRAVSMPSVDGRILLRTDHVQPVPPETRIEHHAKTWFYTDGSSPWRDRATRQRLTELIAAVPALAAEIERRKARKN